MAKQIVFCADGTWSGPGNPPGTTDTDSAAPADPALNGNVANALGQLPALPHELAERILAGSWRRAVNVPLAPGSLSILSARHDLVPRTAARRIGRRPSGARYGRLSQTGSKRSASQSLAGGVYRLVILKLRYTSVPEIFVV